jgi:ubiquinone/menaquinone biosynthesis C-methylase UbiE
MSVSERLFARWYPTVIGWSEDAGQREVRARVFGDAYGCTLEIGAGAGHNLPHYSAAVSELVVSEPGPQMLDHLRRRMAEAPPQVGRWQLVRAGAEQLPFDDGSFDTVTAAFVHCTIPDPAAALREIARVLRPGGQYLFLEHVRSAGRWLGGFQDLVEFPHTVIAAGCHPNRPTERLLAESPLTVRRIEHGRMPRASPTVRPTIHGVASA